MFFSIFFKGAGKSILFNKKTIPSIASKTKANFTINPRIFLLELVFL